MMYRGMVIQSFIVALFLSFNIQFTAKQYCLFGALLLIWDFIEFSIKEKRKKNESRKK